MLGMTTQRGTAVHRERPAGALIALVSADLSVLTHFLQNLRALAARRTGRPSRRTPTSAAEAALVQLAPDGLGRDALTRTRLLRIGVALMGWQYRSTRLRLHSCPTQSRLVI